MKDDKFYNVNAELIYKLYDNSFFNTFILKVKESLVGKIVRFYYDYDDLCKDNYYNEVFYVKDSKYFKVVGWINHIRKYIRINTDYNVCLNLYKNFCKTRYENYVCYNRKLLIEYQRKYINNELKGLFFWIDLKKAYDVILYFLGGFKSFESFKKYIKLDKVLRKFTVGASLRDFNNSWQVWFYGKLLDDKELTKGKYYGLKIYWYLIAWFCKNVIFNTVNDLSKKYKIKIDILLFWVDCVFLSIEESSKINLKDIIRDFKLFLNVNFYNYFTFLKESGYYKNLDFFNNSIDNYVGFNYDLYEFVDYFDYVLTLKKWKNGVFKEKKYFLKKEVFL